MRIKSCIIPSYACLCCEKEANERGEPTTTLFCLISVGHTSPVTYTIVFWSDPHYFPVTYTNFFLSDFLGLHVWMTMQGKAKYYEMNLGRTNFQPTGIFHLH